MCLVEIYAAGPRAIEEIDRTTDGVQAFLSATLEQVPGRQGMPPEIVRAMVGGVRKVIHSRLYRHEEEELIELIPQMWDWFAAYEPPPEPLRRPRGRAAQNGGPPNGYDPAERILRALAAVVAEKGYPAMTIGDIAARASISLSTFYANFADKEEAMLAAVDSGSSQMLATTLPAFRRAPDWPHAVRGAFGAMFAFCAAEPEYTTLGAVDVYAAGRRALEQRDEVMRTMEGPAGPGLRAQARRQPDRRRGNRRRDLLDDLRPDQTRRCREHAGSRARSPPTSPSPPSSAPSKPARSPTATAAVASRPVALVFVGVAEAVDRLAVLGEFAERRCRGRRGR